MKINVVGMPAHVQPPKATSTRCSWVAAFAVALLLQSLAAGASYYVDPVQGNDSSGNGSSDSPWATVVHAVQNAADASTIYLRNGSYGYCTIEGAPARSSWQNKVVIRPQDGHSPTIEGMSISNSPAAYLEFQNLTFQRTAPLTEWCVLVENATHVRLSGCVLRGYWVDEYADAWRTTDGGVWIRYDSGHVYIENCEITQVQSGVSLVQYPAGPVEVRGCHVHKFYRNGLRQASYYATNNAFAAIGNTIADHRSGAKEDGAHMHGSGLTIRNSNTTIIGNVVSGAGGSGAIRFYQGDDGASAPMPGGYSNCIVENNLVYGIPSSTVVFARWMGNDFTFRNNTIVGVWGKKGTSRQYLVGTITFGFDPAATKKNINIYNNIMLMYTAVMGDFFQESNVSNNLFWSLNLNGGFQSAPYGPDSMLVSNSYYGYSSPFYATYFEEPGKFFVGGENFLSAFNTNDSNVPAPEVFRLADGSIALGAADPAHAPPLDLAGNLRGTSPALGAYEGGNAGNAFSSGNTSNTFSISTIANQNIEAGANLTFDVPVNNPQDKPLVLSASGLPSGATFVEHTFSWTPTTAQLGSYQVTFTASDGQTQASRMVTIVVEEANAAPVLADIGSKSTNENQVLRFSISATDGDGDSLTYSASGLPSGASFIGQTFNWTPGYDQAGTYSVTFSASDGRAQDSQTITISVANVNRPPTLAAIGDRSVDENNVLALALSATDPDGTGLTYSATGLPAGANLADGNFTWTPTADQVGSHEITFTVSDGTLTDSETMTIMVVSAAADYAGPVVARQSPAPGAIQVPLNNLITLHVTDAGQGVNPASVTITVDGQTVYQGDSPMYASSFGTCTRSGVKNDYEFIYQNDRMFDFDHEVVVTVGAADLAGNVMPPSTYSFGTEMRVFGSNTRASQADTNSKGAPATVGDAAGNLWAAWHAGPVGARDIYVARLPAGQTTFENPIQITRDSADQCNPDLALAANGALYVVWQDNRQGQWDIFGAVNDNGQVFSKETVVTDANDNQTAPSVAVDSESSNRIWVAWQDDRNGNQDIYVASSTNAFASVTTSRVTTDTADQTEPDLVVGGANLVYLAWTDARNGQADIYGATPGNSWANVPLVLGPGNQTNPALAAHGSALHLLWVDDVSGDSDIYYASSNGLSTSPLTGVNIIDDTSGAAQTAPALACTDDAKVFACWQDARNIGVYGNDTDIYFAELTSGGAKTNVLVNDGGANANQSEPALAVSTNGQPYIIWTDDRDTTTEIYCAATTYVDPTPLYATVVAADLGATVGIAPSAISRPDDVSIVVPAGACRSDVRVTISKILNPLITPDDCLGSYDFGPSGIEFGQPVTVTIPYRVSGNRQARAYWYNSLTGALSQQGMTDIENITVNGALYALRFKTTHFTPYYIVADGADVITYSRAGSVGGCSMSATGDGSPAQLLVPYAIVAVAMAILRRRDKKRAMRDVGP